MKATGLQSIDSAFEKIKSLAESRWRELHKSGRTVIMVGTATCGRAAGALEVLQKIKDEIRMQGLDCSVIEVGCLGHCYAEPVVIISKPGYPPICYARVNPVIGEKLIRDFILGDDPCFEFVLGALEKNDLIPSFSDFSRATREQKILLKNCGHLDPMDIEHYIASGGYAALAKAIRMPPEQVIDEEQG